MKDINHLIREPSSGSKEFAALVTKSTEGLQRYYLLVAAWELGLFEHTVTPKTPQELSQQLGSHEIMTTLFCEALTRIGLLTKNGGKYVNSSLTTNHLITSASLCQDRTVEKLKNNAEHWAQLSTIIKDGPIKSTETVMFRPAIIHLMAEGCETGSVFKIIDVVKEHLDIQRWRKMLDIGGGHGLYAIAFAALNSDLDVFVFDQPHVTPVTSQYIDAYNAQRVQLISGDYNKDSIGQGYDAIFSSFNQTGSDPKFISTFADALNPNGDLIIRRPGEHMHNDPVKNLDWSLVQFKGHKIGLKPHSFNTRISEAEYIKRLEEAGFSVHATVVVDEMSEIIFARKTL
jgi:protein-L-isoaspartate O-methyltransferase